MPENVAPTPPVKTDAAKAQEPAPAAPKPPVCESCGDSKKVVCGQCAALKFPEYVDKGLSRRSKFLCFGSDHKNPILATFADGIEPNGVKTMLEQRANGIVPMRRQ